MKIDKNTTLEKILDNPGAEKILSKNKVPCMTCPMARFEINKLTIGQVAEMYGLDLEKILNDLNKK